MHKGNIANLRVPTTEEAREMGRKGGLASAAARAKRKGLANVLNEFLAQEINPTFKKQLEEMNIKTDGMTNEALYLIGIINGIAKGDIKAVETLAKFANDDKKRELEIKQLEQENKLLKEQIKKTKAETEILKQTQDEGIEIEDSQNLAKMLELEESNDHEEKDKDDSTSNTTN